jgi:serine/threonine-protein kinase
MPTDIYVEDILRGFSSPKILSEEGGQKVVYTVKLLNYGKSVLKIGKYESGASLERIKREVKVLKEIDSKYFPRNYDFKIVDQDRYFILEEYLDGGTLKDNFPDYFSEQAAISLIVELVNGLCILWEKNIVHRDLKPQNIIISNGIPKIIDLGIARLLDETSITLTWAPYGPRTPAYASPEQTENRKSQIDFRSDQFSLGIIFAQLVLNGEHPFNPEIVGNQNSLLENIKSASWAKNHVSQKVSPETMQVISKLLGHDPYERYRKIQELKYSLRKLKGE